MKSVFIKTLGCKVNTYDSNTLAGQFSARGYELVDNAASADITVINSCSVTATAEREARYLLRRYQREQPESIRVMTGCYAQIQSGRIAELEHVDLVVPNEAKDRLVDFVEELDEGDDQPGAKVAGTTKPVIDNRQGHFKTSLELLSPPMTERVRAFIKVQDGCNGFCAYCQIPYARGASRSLGASKVLEAARAVLERGATEIVLTGIHIGDYGKDLEAGRALADVLEELFALPGLGRLRISSLEPVEATPALLAVLKRNEARFCGHFHLPLQSGDDRILKAMRRSYDTATYKAKVDEIRGLFPNAHISADIIPGFPGEDDASFVRTQEFVRACGFASLHVFPYSPRPNTAALRFPDKVDPATIKERAARLRKMGEEGRARFMQRAIGQERAILWERYDDERRRLVGKSGDYLNVLGPEGFGSHADVGRIEACSIKGMLSRNELLAVQPTRTSSIS